MRIELVDDFPPGTVIDLEEERMFSVLPEPEDPRFWLTMARLRNHEDFRAFLEWMQKDAVDYQLEVFRRKHGADGADDYRVFLALVDDLTVMFKMAYDKARTLEEGARQKAAEEERRLTAPSGDGSNIV